MCCPVHQLFLDNILVSEIWSKVHCIIASFVLETIFNKTYTFEKGLSLNLSIGQLHFHSIRQKELKYYCILKQIHHHLNILLKKLLQTTWSSQQSLFRTPCTKFRYNHTYICYGDVIISSPNIIVIKSFVAHLSLLMLYQPAL